MVRGQILGNKGRRESGARSSEWKKEGGNGMKEGSLDSGSPRKSEQGAGRGGR